MLGSYLKEVAMVLVDEQLLTEMVLWSWVVFVPEHTFLLGQEAMVQAASDEDLKSATQNHIQQTRQHIHNIERVFEDLGQNARRETNEAAQGLLKEAKEGLQETQSGGLRDLAIVSAVVKVEHLEVGSYRSLAPAAQLMGLMNQGEVVNLLNENLRQEEETAQIAEQSVPGLLRKAEMSTGEESEQQEEDKGLIDKAKDTFTGR